MYMKCTELVEGSPTEDIHTLDVPSLSSLTGPHSFRTIVLHKQILSLRNFTLNCWFDSTMHGRAYPYVMIPISIEKCVTVCWFHDTLFPSDLLYSQ